MNKNKLAFLIITVALMSLVGCGQKKSQEEHPPKIVKTKIIKTEHTTLKRDFPGIVKSSSNTNLSFDISGRLIKLPIKEGMKLRKGQLVAQLESDKQNFKLNSAKADFLEAQSDFNRNKQLYSQGVISAAEYQLRKRKYEIAKASLDLAKKELRYTFLKAPFTGVITKKISENFQYVKSKETVAVFQDLNDLEVEINVPENLMSYENKINSMTFDTVFESYPDKKFKLKFKSLGQQADAATKTYPVKFYIVNKEDAVILPGMTSTVFTQLSTDNTSKSNYISVPASAIFTNADGQKCLWIVKDDIVFPSVVEVNEIKNDKAVILDGVKQGDRVVLSGVHQLLDGDKIKEYERLDLAK